MALKATRGDVWSACLLAACAIVLEAHLGIVLKKRIIVREHVITFVAPIQTQHLLGSTLLLCKPEDPEGIPHHLTAFRRNS